MDSVKTVRIPKELLKIVKRRARTEGVDESTAIRQLISMGIKNYAVDLYRNGKITLREAAEIANVSVREMIDILLEHGVQGNVRFDQQKKALEFVSKIRSKSVDQT
ncbi:MAG: UPF0175 family protein [Nitrososphaerales archaeon]